jgi:putative transposase
VSQPLQLLALLYFLDFNTLIKPPINISYIKFIMLSFSMVLVLSRYKFPYLNICPNNIYVSSVFMKKLNKRKIRWIVREMKLGLKTIQEIANQQNITPKWVTCVYKKYADKKLYDKNSIVFYKPGKHERVLTTEEINKIMKVRKTAPYGAVTIEKLLKEEGVNIPHNQIHKVLIKNKMANIEPKKANKRKWVRYEREYSNSLWHVDWCEDNEDKIIVYEDDASRFVTGYGVFNSATTDNSARVLVKAIKENGKPDEMVSDHGTQFVSLPREGCDNPEKNRSQKTLEVYGIKHIKAKVKHPQTNGKVERLFRTLKILKEFSGSWDEAIKIYNYKRVHMSLETDNRLRTPKQAYVEKTKKDGI